MLRLSVKTHRTPIDITAHMVEQCSSPVLKTHLMHRTNLSYELLEKYLSILLKAKLLSVDRAGKFYTRTVKGQIFLNLYEEFNELEKKAGAKRNLLRSLIKDETDGKGLLENNVPGRPSSSSKPTVNGSWFEDEVT